MDFNALRAIVKNIRSQVTCPHCENSYANEDLSVVSAIDNRCVLLAQCNHCSTPILITATINEAIKGSRKASIVTEQRRLEELREEELITPDDVLKVHELLKDYKGDLEQLFKGADKKE